MSRRDALPGSSAGFCINLYHGPISLIPVPVEVISNRKADDAAVLLLGMLDQLLFRLEYRI